MNAWCKINKFCCCISYWRTSIHPFNGPFPGLPGWAGTRKVKRISFLLKQETVSGYGISWAICKSAPRSRQITMPVPHHSVFYRPDALPAAQPTASKHWRHVTNLHIWGNFCLPSIFFIGSKDGHWVLNPGCMVDVVTPLTPGCPQSPQQCAAPNGKI